MAINGLSIILSQYFGSSDQGHPYYDFNTIVAHLGIGVNKITNYELNIFKVHLRIKAPKL